MISVKNFSGILTVHRDGSWVSEKPGKHKQETHPDPVRNLLEFLCSYKCRILAVFIFIFLLAKCCFVRWH